MKYTIYSKLNCPWCDKAKKLLDDYNFPYEEKILNIDYTRDELINIIPRDIPLTVPQIFFLEDRYIGGYTELLSYFEQTGVFGLQQ